MTRYWILVSAFLAASCSSTADDADTAQPPVALVKLATATRGDGLRRVTLYGAAEAGPTGRVSLTAPVEAHVASILAPAGTPVRKGQVVAVLAASPTTRADAAKATADALSADQALARVRRLRADGLASDADVEAAHGVERATKALQASFAARERHLQLRASTSGVVDTVSAAIGDLVQPGALIATVARSGDVRAKFGIDPGQRAFIATGAAIQISDGAQRPPIAAQVESVGAATDPQTRLASVYTRIPASSGIVAGEVLTATMDLAGSAAGVSVPYAALLDDAGQPYVFAVKGGVAHRRDVVVQPARGDRAIVTNGLQPGDQVVVEGGTAVEDGMKVRTR